MRSCRHTLFIPFDCLVVFLQAPSISYSYFIGNSCVSRKLREELDEPLYLPFGFAFISCKDEQSILIPRINLKGCFCPLNSFGLLYPFELINKGDCNVCFWMFRAQFNAFVETYQSLLVECGIHVYISQSDKKLETIAVEVQLSIIPLPSFFVFFGNGIGERKPVVG